MGRLIIVNMKMKMKMKILEWSTIVNLNVKKNKKIKKCSKNVLKIQCYWGIFF